MQEIRLLQPQEKHRIFKFICEESTKIHLHNDAHKTKQWKNKTEFN